MRQSPLLALLATLILFSSISFASIKFCAGTLLLALALFVSLALLKIHLTSNGPGRSVTYPFGQTFNQENLFMTTVHRGHKTNFWEAPHPQCSAVINTTSVESNQINRWHDRLSHLEKFEIKLLKDDPVCLKNICPNTSFCFLGACFCHPGYEGEKCSLRKIPGNPWYTESCPNLLSTSTADMTVPLHMLGGEYSQVNHVPEEGSPENSTFTSSVPVRNKCVGSPNPTACAYLCYSHSAYGTAVVPHSLWQAAQDAEGDLFGSVMMMMMMMIVIMMMVMVMDGDSDDNGNDDDDDEENGAHTDKRLCVCVCICLRAIEAISIKFTYKTVPKTLLEN